MANRRYRLEIYNRGVTSTTGTVAYTCGGYIPQMSRRQVLGCLKRCPRCGESKPLTAEYFSPGAGRKDGTRLLRGVCKVCAAKLAASYRERNPAKVLAYLRHYEATKRDKEKRRANARKRWHARPRTERERAQARACVRRYRQRHPDRDYARYLEDRESGKRAAYAKAFRERNREKMRIWNAISTARWNTRNRMAEGTFTPEDIARLYETQEGCCFYCHSLLGHRWEVDHKIPLSRGGSNWPTNLCCCCRSCNARKSDLTADEFIERLAHA